MEKHLDGEVIPPAIKPSRAGSSEQSHSSRRALSLRPPVLEYLREKPTFELICGFADDSNVVQLGGRLQTEANTGKTPNSQAVVAPRGRLLIGVALLLCRFA